MADKFTVRKRSEIMSRVKGQDTLPEKLVRSCLHRLGFRFRLQDKKLPGKPDIVLKRHRKVVFVHGCFWHGHKGCSRAALPTSNVDFWNEKITSNIARDKRNIRALRREGWKTLVIWQCRLRNTDRLVENLIHFMKEE